jgi:hypothetical protein
VLSIQKTPAKEAHVLYSFFALFGDFRERSMAVSMPAIAILGNLANPAKPNSILSEAVARTPLSTLSWNANQGSYGDWIERNRFPGFPWVLSAAGQCEAEHRRQLAFARGEILGPPTATASEVIADAVGWCFSDAAWCLLLGQIQARGLWVSGVRYGTREVIDALVLTELFVDLTKDIAMLWRGRWTWHALAIEWDAPEKEAPSLTLASSELLPTERSLRSEFAKWYAAVYPQGHPVGKKQEDLAYEAAGALGRKVSARTVRRSLRAFQPRTSAAR